MMDNIMIKKDVIQEIVRLSDQEHSEKYGINKRNDLFRYLESLSYMELLDVESLMLFGRGDYDSLEDAVNDMRGRYANGGSDTDKEMAITYIIGKTPLHSYLANGIEKAGMYEICG